MALLPYLLLGLLLYRLRLLPLLLNLRQRLLLHPRLLPRQLPLRLLRPPLLRLLLLPLLYRLPLRRLLLLRLRLRLPLFLLLRLPPLLLVLEMACLLYSP
jgi:hypothetical protein